MILVGGTGVGCVERTLTITSDPPGALVHLNDEEIGRTPTTVPFTFYGVYDVRLEKEGYATLETGKETKAPLWEAPGPDLIAEMIPNNKVKLEWHFVLEKAGEISPEGLIDRAKQMRAKMRKELGGVDGKKVAEED